MTREEAKNWFRTDVDSYGKPKAIMHKIDKIYDDFEKEQTLKSLYEELKQIYLKHDKINDKEIKSYINYRLNCLKNEAKSHRIDKDI